MGSLLVLLYNGRFKLGPSTRRHYFHQFYHSLTNFILFCFPSAFLRGSIWKCCRHNSTSIFKHSSLSWTDAKNARIYSLLPVAKALKAQNWRLRPSPMVVHEWYWHERGKGWVTWCCLLFLSIVVWFVAKIRDFKATFTHTDLCAYQNKQPIKF